MTHPNEFPDKKFIPSEGTMPVATVEWPVVVSPEREGIAGISPEGRYFADLALAESIEEAAALGPEPIFGTLSEAAAVQPDLRELSESYEP